MWPGALPADSRLRLRRGVAAGARRGRRLLRCVRAAGCTWALLLGDASGKGVAAGLVASAVQARVHTAARLAHLVARRPDGRGRSRRLFHDGARYATAIYATLEAATRRLQVVNAGHPVARCSTPRTRRGDAHAATGPALGLIEAGRVRQRGVTLSPGDPRGLHGRRDRGARRPGRGVRRRAPRRAGDGAARAPRRRRVRGRCSTRSAGIAASRQDQDDVTVLVVRGRMIRTLLVDDEQPARERLRAAARGARGRGDRRRGRGRRAGGGAHRRAVARPGACSTSRCPAPAASTWPRRSAAAARGDLLHGLRSIRGGRLRAVGHRLPAEAREPRAAGRRARSRAAEASPARERDARSIHRRARKGSRPRDSSRAEARVSAWCRCRTWSPSPSSTASRTCSPPPNNSRCSPRWPRWPAGSIPRHFFQVSRNAIIHLDAVREAKPFSDGTGEIVLANGQTMAVARRRWRSLIEKLEG